MDSHKFLYCETAAMAIGQAVCVAVMILVFLLLDRYDRSVLWGGIVGGGIALLNDHLMVLFADLAADRAQKQNVASGRKLVQLSYLVRMMGLGVVLLLCGLSGWFHGITLVAPLVFRRPILAVIQRIRGKVDRPHEFEC